MTTWKFCPSEGIKSSKDSILIFRTLRGLDYLGKTLKQLWISYNEIEKLEPFKNLIKLEKLYIGNNLIQKIEELNVIAHLPLKEVVFRGNPFTLEVPSQYDSKPQDKERAVIADEIKKRLPSIEMLDGDPV